MNTYNYLYDKNKIHLLINLLITAVYSYNHIFIEVSIEYIIII